MFERTTGTNEKWVVHNKLLRVLAMRTAASPDGEKKL
jgi:hypothetical protein